STRFSRGPWSRTRRSAFIVRASSWTASKRSLCRKEVDMKTPQRSSALLAALGGVLLSASAFGCPEGTHDDGAMSSMKMENCVANAYIDAAPTNENRLRTGA